MTLFIWGTIVGALVGFSALFALVANIARKENKKAKDAEPKGPSDKERIALALNRFGQIATRVSIKEARKLANQAIKEIGEPE